MSVPVVLPSAQTLEDLSLSLQNIDKQVGVLILDAHSFFAQPQIQPEEQMQPFLQEIKVLAVRKKESSYTDRHTYIHTHNRTFTQSFALV